MNWQAGAVVTVPYPFVRDTFTDHEREDGEWNAIDVPTWRPGTRCDPSASDNCDYVADAMGAQVLTVVGVYQPPGYPTRVFFTRKWRDPDGREFGKGKLRITALWAFTSLTRGYRHSYDLTPVAAPDALESRP